MGSPSQFLSKQWIDLVANMQLSIDKLTTLVNDSDIDNQAMIDKLTETVTELQKNTSDNANMVTKLTDTVSELQSNNADNNTIVTKLTDTVNKLTETVTALNSNNTDNTDMINKLTTTVNELQNVVAKQTENVQAVKNNGGVYVSSSDVRQIDYTKGRKGTTADYAPNEKKPFGILFKVLAEGMLKVNATLYETSTSTEPYSNMYYRLAVWVNGVYIGASANTYNGGGNRQYEIEVMKGDIVELGILNNSDYTKEWDTYLDDCYLSFDTINAPGEAYSL